MARIIDFFDGAQSETVPVIGNIIASNLIKYPDDATYEATEQGAPVTGNLYYNTTLNLIRYYTGSAWISLVDESSNQTLQNKSVDGSTTGNNIVKTIAENVEVTPSGDISSTNVGAALTELDNEKQALSEKGQPSGYASLDAGGKIPSAQIPPVALTSVSVVADNTARDALVVEEGDVAQTTDSGKWWIYDGAAWQEMVTPASVTSVNGQSGAVDLDLDDITGVDLTTSPPGTNDVLTYDGSNWVPAPAGDAFENVTSRSATGTLLITEEMVTVDSSGGALTLTLPASSGNSGKKYRIKKITSDFNAVTIDGNGAETIDGQTTTSINTFGEIITIICDGADWLVVDRYIPDIEGSYVPTANTGAKGGTTVDLARYRREGKYLYVDYIYRQNSSGSSGSQFYTWTMPSGIVVDSTLQEVGTNGVVDIAFSSAAIFDSTNNKTYLGVVGMASTTQFYVQVMNDVQAPDFVGLTSTIGAFGAITINMAARFRVPIQGWNS